MVLVRSGVQGPEVLMGQRGARAAFMPELFVFPGGAVDPGDAGLPFAAPLDPDSERRLGLEAAPGLASALAFAAVRELWEETGLRLAHAGAAPDPETLPADWQDFVTGGFRPRTEALRFIFRAITPPGRPRRFDARFFLVEAGAIAGRVDDFALASGELARLQWIGIAAARTLPLPFITGIVLSEVAGRLADPDLDRRQPVPFFDNRSGGSRFRML